MKYIKELDGVRAIAAIMVVISHHFSTNKVGGGFVLELFQRFTSIGQIGVTIFFVLSGFLITSILVETKSKHNFFKTFYARRFLRIFPLYFFALALYYFLPYLLFNVKIPEFSSQIYYWLYIQNISDTFKLGAIGPSHFWSLAIEEQFYLFWPLVIFYSSEKILLRISIVLVLIAAFLRIIFLASSLEIYYFTFTRMDDLCLGAILAILYRQGILNHLNTWLNSSLALAILLLGSLWFFFGGQGIVALQSIKYSII